jgi:outer membrane protein OmpA-like peptidoglycan-associated protein
MRAWVVIAVAAWCGGARADAPGTADHPAVKRFEGSTIFFGKARDFDEFRLALSKIEWSGSEAKTKPYESKVVEGKTLKNYYAAPAGISVLEVYRNYENELKSRGFEILFSARGEDLETRGYNNQIAKEIFRITKPYGSPEESADWALSISDDSKSAYIAARKPGEGGAGDLYVSVYVFPNSDITKEWFGKIGVDRAVVRFDVCETKAMQQRMVTVKSDEMASAIQTAGRIALYGILFDFNKTDIKSESDATLAEIGKLLAATPKLKLLVVGHTDNVGAFEFNRDLSQRRAASVVDALVSRHGVSRERLFPFGVSYASPVASNASEDGRAKNRRVELVEYLK